jgi:hypothetical protein
MPLAAAPAPPRCLRGLLCRRPRGRPAPARMRRCVGSAQVSPSPSPWSRGSPGSQAARLTAQRSLGQIPGGGAHIGVRQGVRGSGSAAGLPSGSVFSGGNRIKLQGGIGCREG